MKEMEFCFEVALTRHPNGDVKQVTALEYLE